MRLLDCLCWRLLRCAVALRCGLPLSDWNTGMRRDFFRAARWRRPEALCIAAMFSLWES